MRRAAGSTTDGVERTGALQRLLDRQRRWAMARGVRVDAADRVLRVEDNLFRPLSPLTRQDFRVGGGFELRGDMRSLLSSAALACNVFEPWRPRSLSPLLATCRADARASCLGFERGFSTGLRGQVAHARVFLDGNGAEPCAIECSLGEPYAPARDELAEAVLGDEETWRGLPLARALAQDVARGCSPFHKLDAARLLKLVLALTRSYGVGGFRLLVLWYDDGCSEAAAHAQELDAFARSLSGELHFAVMRWQELYLALQRVAPAEESQLAYLGDRYFDAGP